MEAEKDMDNAGGKIMHEDWFTDGLMTQDWIDV